MKPTVDNLQGRWVMYEDKTQYNVITLEGNRYTQSYSAKVWYENIFTPLTGDQIKGRWYLKGNVLYLKKKEVDGDLLSHLGFLGKIPTSALTQFSELIMPDGGRPIVDVTEAQIKFKDGAVWRKLSKG